MALMGSDFQNLGGGLIKASSWADAVVKAKSWIYVSFGIKPQTAIIRGSFIIPKDQLSSTTKSWSMSSAVNNSSIYYFQIDAALTTATLIGMFNGTAYAIQDAAFYYDA